MEDAEELPDVLTDTSAWQPTPGDPSAPTLRRAGLDAQATSSTRAPNDLIAPLPGGVALTGQGGSCSEIINAGVFSYCSGATSAVSRRASATW
jgi:hypothetical protein